MKKKIKIQTKHETLYMYTRASMQMIAFNSIDLYQTQMANISAVMESNGENAMETE